MPIANIQFTKEYLFDSLRHHQRHRGNFVELRTQILAMIIVTPVMFGVAMFDGIWRFIGAVGMTALPLLIITRKLSEWRIRRNFKNSLLADSDLRIEFTESGVATTTPHGDSRSHWTAFSEAVEFRDGFLIYQGKNVLNWIPLASLESPPDAEQLAVLLQENIQKYRVREPIAVSRETSLPTSERAGRDTGDASARP